MERKFILYLFLLALLIVLVPFATAFADTGGAGILKVGSSGEKVSELQTLLKKEGFFPVAQKVTGYYGPITYNSVVALEKKYGLSVNGQVGPEEWNILHYKKASGVVLGYYAVDYPGDRESHNSLLKYNQLVDQVAMFDFGVDWQGNLIGNVSSEGIKLARAKGVKSLMVVHNISGSIDTKSAHSAISGKNRKNLIENIVREIKENGYSGVNIDFEGIPPAGKNDFNAFLEELSGKLRPMSKLITVAVPAKTSDNGSNWNGAYDYKAIGRLSDYVVIMTYDEHWFSGPAGPVASIPWMTRVLDYSTGVIPPGKILMGIPAYGYDWPDGRKGKAIKWKNVQGLIDMLGYWNVKWDNYNSVPYLTYKKDGISHQVWFENKYSLSIKLGLVKKYGIGGIAIWRMGFEDDSFWETVRQKL
ncbi:MAG: glycosyl hydrolase family 18 protein [Firmicutes bacterium]|nr:glycosyl hydrolase family 18 protein [Bacillota bacterium]